MEADEPESDDPSRDHGGALMNERISAYLDSLEQALPGELESLEEEALSEFIPILRKEEQSFLRTILLLEKPERILEVGTGTGFSALFMRHFIPENAKIVTIESYAPRIKKAKAHFDAYGKGQITLLSGDAEEILPTLSEPFDLIFLDAAKGQYPVLLPELLRLLRVGGVLLADNVLQQGMILDVREVVKQRDRSTHDRMREFLYKLTHDPSLSTAILPMGDGMSFTVKES